VNLFRSQEAVGRQLEFKKSGFVSETVWTWPLAVKCPKEFSERKARSQMNEKQKIFRIVVSNANLADSKIRCQP
jgi:hypothetical protein